MTTPHHPPFDPSTTNNTSTTAHNYNTHLYPTTLSPRPSASSDRPPLEVPALTVTSSPGAKSTPLTSSTPTPQSPSDDMAKGSTSLIDPRYCCCAVPMVNAGMYAIIAEQAAVAIATAVLCFTAPSVPGVATPTFVTYILAIICLVGLAVQPVGFLGAFREKTKTFRVYSTINAIVTLAAFIVAAVIIIVSAVRHDQAMATCEKLYFTPPASASQQAEQTLTDESAALCNAFTWADIGFMGGLWVLLGLTQSYFVYCTRKYGVSQVEDHKLYHSVYSENPEAFTMSILQSRRYNGTESMMWTNSMAGPSGPAANDAWDARRSYDEPHLAQPGPDAGGAYYHHSRGYSDGRADGNSYPYGDNAYADSPTTASNLTPASAHNPYAFKAPGPGYVDNNPSHSHSGSHHV